MPRFSYRARKADGSLVTGMLDGGSADMVASQLLGSGITPVFIREAAAGQTDERPLGQLLARRSVGLEELIIFTRQLYSLVRAGVPIVRALSGLADSSRGQPLAEALKAVVRNLESGHDLSGSLARHPEIFTPIIVSTVRVGENSGQLDVALRRVSEYLAREKDTRERIKTALRYPLMVLGAITVAIAVINIWVIPAFANVFARADMDLPWATRLLIGSSNFFVGWWPVLLGLLVVAMAGLRFWLQTERGRYRWDRVKFRLPIVGPIVQQASLARFARGFAMSLRSGVPLIQGLTVVAQAVDNAYLAERILSMRAGVERGDTLTRTAASTGLFTPLVLQMLGVGEETGQVDEMLDEVGGYYERDVDYAIRNLGAAIEPVLLLAVGVMVLILALGVFLPMWDLASTFRH